MRNDAFKRQLNPSDLILPYTEWMKKVGREISLTEEEMAWLDAWDIYDLAISPIDDEQRRYIRLGHYDGWFDALKKIERERKVILKRRGPLKRLLLAGKVFREHYRISRDPVLAWRLTVLFVRGV